MKKITLFLFLSVPATLCATGVEPFFNANIPMVTYIAIGAACVLLFLLIVLWRMLDGVKSRVNDLEEDLEIVRETKSDEKALSREEVEAMIAERMASVASVPDAAAEVTPELPKEVAPVLPSVIFFGRPTGERMFDDNKKTTEMDENTYYRFALLKNDEENALVFFCPNHTGAIKALDNRVKTIEPACELTIKGDKPQNYRCEEPGRAVIKNGFWTVIRKAKVVYE